jgi:hypothetical protein
MEHRTRVVMGGPPTLYNSQFGPQAAANGRFYGFRERRSSPFLIARRSLRRPDLVVWDCCKSDTQERAPRALFDESSVCGNFISASSSTYDARRSTRAVRSRLATNTCCELFSPTGRVRHINLTTRNERVASRNKHRRLASNTREHPKRSLRQRTPRHDFLLRTRRAHTTATTGARAAELLHDSRDRRAGDFASRNPSERPAREGEATISAARATHRRAPRVARSHRTPPRAGAPRDATRGLCVRLAYAASTVGESARATAEEPSLWLASRVRTCVSREEKENTRPRAGAPTRLEARAREISFSAKSV